MTRLKLLVLVLLAPLAGCTDNIDSVTREYRACNNEAIDAMMMVTNEAQARRFTVRIFKPMGNRYTAIDRKLMIVKSNRNDTEFAKECLESDSVHLYLTDLQLNAQRFDLEQLRIKRIVNTLVEREKQAQGGNVVVNPKDVCPHLLALVRSDVAIPAPGGGGMGGMGGGMAPLAPAGEALGGGGGSVLEPLRKQLFENDLLKLMAEFPAWDKVKDFPEMQAKFMKRRLDFLPKEKIVLVN